MPRTDPGPGVRYPPPLLFVAGLVVGWLLDRAAPLPVAAFRGRAIVGWLLVAIGVGLSVWAVGTFRRAGTTIIPNRPASRLVTHGPFRRSRNPMYLALSLVYLGVAFLLGSVWGFVLFPLVIVILRSTVIGKEERYLEGTFGAEYDEYRRRVRRWL